MLISSLIIHIISLFVEKRPFPKLPAIFFAIRKIFSARISYWVAYSCRESNSDHSPLIARIFICEFQHFFAWKLSETFLDPAKSSLFLLDLQWDANFLYRTSRWLSLTRRLNFHVCISNLFCQKGNVRLTSHPLGRFNVSMDEMLLFRISCCSIPLHCFIFSCCHISFA